MTNEISTQKQREYIVVISGYEGIESILGTFTETGAVEKAKFLKDNAPGRGNGNETDFARRLQEAETLGASGPFGKEQVCIMGPNESAVMDCCCKLLPKEYQNTKMWLH